MAIREINKILSTEMDVLRRSARKSRMERTKNKGIKEIMGVKGKPDIIDSVEKKRLQWYGHLKGCQRQYQNSLWSRYHWREGKEDVQEKRG
jgi:hypothetical protein